MCDPSYIVGTLALCLLALVLTNIVWAVALADMTATRKEAKRMRKEAETK